MLGADMMLEALWKKVGITPQQFQEACVLVMNQAKDAAATMRRLEGRADDTTAELGEIRAQLARMEGLLAEADLDRMEVRPLAGPSPALTHSEG